MAFTQEESVMNGINLDLINQYQQQIMALQPLMLEQSGYKKTLSDTNIRQETRDKLTGYEKQLDLYNRYRAGKGAPQDAAEFNSILSTNGVGTPTNGKQWDNADNVIRQLLGEKINQYKNQMTNERVGYEMTDEAKANQDSYKKLAQTQLQQLQQQAEYLNSPEYKAQVAQQQQIADRQQKNTLAMIQRQQDALDGKIGTSPVLKKQIDDSFLQFKEAQNRAGNIVLGDSLENAVGKGSAATEALAKFQDNVAALKQREVEAIVNQTPLTLASADASSQLFGGMNLGNTGQYASTTFNQAYGTPQMPNYSGLSQLTLAGQQPYQNQAALYMQQQQMQQQMDMQNRANKSGLLSGAMQLGGMLGGAMLGGPMGASFGGQLGGMAGGTTGYSPQFGQVYSPSQSQMGYGA